MTDYTELVKALREAPDDWYDADLHRDAAAAIEDLQAKISELGESYSANLVAAQNAQPRWVRVEEPPKENGRYLVHWQDVVTTDEFKNGVWLYASMFNQRVTHWMPLPEPPKEDA